MVVILHFDRKILCKIQTPLHRCHFVTVLFLDKYPPLWQYIVEVRKKWHNILCFLPVPGIRPLKFKRKMVLLL